MLSLRPLAFVSFLAFGVSVFAQELEPSPDAAAFAKFKPLKAPTPAGLLLRENDRLAIIGDSITEQKMYSRIMETYLTACLPELKVTVRQYGWGGETAEGFKNRMANDALRFSPTIATTRPRSCSALTCANLSCGRTPASTLASSMPTSRATARAVCSLSPVRR